MKGFLCLALICILFSTTNESQINSVGLMLKSAFSSLQFRAQDTMTIITCILHNEVIIKDVNKVIDAILTHDFTKIITTIIGVFLQVKSEVEKCINPTKAFLY